MNSRISCERFIQGIVSHPPTAFGRLIYIAGLRNKATGLYSHPGAQPEFPDESVDRALRSHHLDLFRRWLALPLERQLEEFQTFLAGVGSAADRPATSELMAKLPDLVPAGAARHEIELFHSDLEIVLLMAPPVTKTKACEDRESWQRRLPGFFRLKPSLGQFRSVTKI